VAACVVTTPGWSFVHAEDRPGVKLPLFVRCTDVAGEACC
jgi:hypothetical protein